jgi:DNA-directed RNA polymerase II subunit RPB11
MPAVLFAGYKVPHPLHPYFLLKVQTDGSLTAQAAVESAAANLMLMLRDLETSFKAEFAAKAVDAPAGAPGAAADEPYGAGAGSAWGMGGDYMDM